MPVEKTLGRGRVMNKTIIWCTAKGKHLQHSSIGFMSLICVFAILLLVVLSLDSTEAKSDSDQAPEMNTATSLDNASDRLVVMASSMQEIAKRDEAKYEQYKMKASTIPLQAVDTLVEDVSQLPEKVLHQDAVHPEVNCSHELEWVSLDQDLKAEEQRIERWYAVEHGSLVAWADQWKKALEGKEQIAWARFQQQLQENTVTTKETDVDTRTYGYTNGYISRNGYYSGNTWERTNGRITENTYTHVVGNPAREYERTKRSIDAELEGVERRFYWLDAQRDQKLSELRSHTRNLRERILADCRRAERRMNSTEARHLGDIQSITKASDGPYRVMVDGVFYSAGDTINACKIIHVYGDGVEYEMAGTIQRQSLD